MPQAIIFDLAETLVAVKAARIQANERLFGEVKKLGAAIDQVNFDTALTPLLQDIVESHAGDTHFHDTTTAFVHRALEIAKLPVPSDTHVQLVNIYDQVYARSVTLYADAEIVLPRLRAAGFKLGLVVDGTLRLEQQIVKALNLEHVFDVIVISEEVAENKLTIRPLWTALERLSVPPAKAVVVGNQETRDVVPAKQLGCRAIKLTRTSANTSLISHNSAADATVKTLLELEKLLRVWTYAKVPIN